MFEYEIIESMGVISTHENGWKKEVNIVSWRGARPKVDIRDWDADHERMARGITLTEDEAKALYEILKERYGA